MPPGEGFSSPEFELVLACVRWPVTPAGAARILELAQRPLDWPLLLKIAEQHQVVSLVSRNLEASAPGCVPSQPLAALRESTVENARGCFQNISELVRLTRIFCEQGIDLRILKGAPLAITAFGDPTLRGMGDIDLLVREADLPAADRILRAEGYLRCEPEAWRTPRRMRSYIAHQKDFSYDHPTNHCAIDLHWRLFRNPWLAANAGLEQVGIAWIQLGPERIPTLPVERLFLYLCVHGALDGWLRLKWLADIGALLAGISQENLASVVQAAKSQKSLPELSAAILLCRERLRVGHAAAGSLSAEDPAVARILRFANRLMTSNDCCPERERIPTTAWFLNEFFLHPSPRSRAELLERSLFRPRVWREISLPDAFFPLYAFLSPVEWITFRIERSCISLLRKAKRSNSGPNRKASRLPRRFFGLALSDIALLAEAGSLLTFFRIALRFFPVQQLTIWMGKAPKEDPAEESPPEDQARQTLRQVEWAVGAVVRHAPFTFVCFPQSLAAYFMLRRRQIPSRLFYGVAREEHQLKAHTWIKVGERTVVGGESESRFTVIAIFP